MLEYEAGNWDRALEAVDELEQTTAQTGWNVNNALAHATRALVEGSRGEVDEARARVSAALEETEQPGTALAVPADGARDARGIRRAPRRGAELLERVLARNRERGVRDPRSTYSAVEALAGLSRLDEAEALLAEVRAELHGPGGRGRVRPGATACSRRSEASSSRPRPRWRRRPRSGARSAYRSSSAGACLHSAPSVEGRGGSGTHARRWPRRSSSSSGSARESGPTGHERRPRGSAAGRRLGPG